MGKPRGAAQRENENGCDRSEDVRAVVYGARFDIHTVFLRASVRDEAQTYAAVRACGRRALFYRRLRHIPPADGLAAYRERGYVLGIAVDVAQLRHNELRMDMVVSAQGRAYRRMDVAYSRLVDSLPHDRRRSDG